jgi:glycerol 2-dehydrogenase (NADP+)
VALGTFKITENCAEVVRSAIVDHGYRHIDCAKVYQNEEEVGKGIKAAIEAGVTREELFITTKLWHTDKAKVEEACRESLGKLGLDYVDLYLIHWMTPGLNTEGEEWTTTGPPQYLVWKDMEALVKNGLVKSIGVSNATAPILIDLIAGAEIRPAINQIEVHPYLA